MQLVWTNLSRTVNYTKNREKYRVYSVRPTKNFRHLQLALAAWEHQILLFELFEKYPNVHTSFCIQNGNLREKAREINLSPPKKISYDVHIISYIAICRYCLQLPPNCRPNE